MTDAPEPVRRRLEIEDPTNVYVVHAIANRLLPLFARWRIPPNAVSLAGMGFGILAGFAYHECHRIGFVVLGFLLMVGWHVMDGIDGQLARLTSTQSEFGKVVDGICDYTTFGAVYLGLALALLPAHGAGVLLLVAVAGVAHAVQSAIYELQRQDYLHWGCGQGSAASPEPGARTGATSGMAPHRRIADALLGVYLGLQRAATGPDAERRALADAMTRPPERVAQRRQAYRDSFAPSLRRWSVMSANTRTIAIFVFAACGWPVLFFWFEIVGLGAILVVLLARQRARTARFLRSLPTTS